MNQVPQNHPQPVIDAVRSYREIHDLLPPHWIQGQITANGIRQHYYRTGGAGPPVLLLHGFLEGALSWLRLALELEDEYDLVMVDARGHGRSDRVSSGFSQALLTEDVIACARALDLERIHVIGFSQGGLTGIHVADAAPALVQSLVVTGWGEVQRTDFNQSEGYRRWLGSFVRWLEALKSLSHEDRMQAALNQLPPGAPLLPEVEYVPWAENSANLDLDLVRMGDSLWTEVGERTDAAGQALGRLRCPVLLMKSAFYTASNREIEVEGRPSEHPHIRVVEFKNAGHLIQRDAYEPYLTLIQEFLGAQAGPRT